MVGLSQMVVLRSHEVVGYVPNAVNVEMERDATRRVCRVAHVVSCCAPVEHPPWPATSPSITNPQFLRVDIAKVFAAVLTACDGQGLIGREMFAIDGVKLPSNASMNRSGTRAEFTPRAEKLETTAQTMLERHRATDAGYYSEANLAALAVLVVTALIADQDMRQRDEWFAGREHHTTTPDPLHDKSRTAKKPLPLFASSDLTYDAEWATRCHVESVFANVRYNKRLDRFTLRAVRK